MRKPIQTIVAALFLPVAACLVLAVGFGGASKPPAPAAGPTLEVFPPSVSLQGARAAQAIIARIVQPDGRTMDVTSKCRITLADPAVAHVEDGALRPCADGSTELTVAFEGRTQKIPVKVKDGQVDRPVSFKLDIMPIFLRAGCNTGGCHGSARGKDGFRLSLFGFDPDGDYQRITREQATRRINLAMPEESLLITKITGKVPHTGGTRFKADSPLNATLMRWLEAGAPADPPAIAHPVALELMPGSGLIEEGDKMQLLARARYSDGSERDVTSLVLFSSNNDPAATVTENGLVQAVKRGEAFIMARFATFTVGTQVIVIPKNQAYASTRFPESNYIDACVNAKLARLRIAPSELCTDEQFIRRAYLDIVGLLPTRAELESFIVSSQPDKREKLIDQLLSRKEFVELWVMKWAELLQIRSDPQNRMSYKAVVLYFNWLQERIANNVPFDQIVQELLASNGGTFTNPATNYYQVERDPQKIAENTAQVFMGMRIQCAQCHNHPFDRWTLDDYYGFASFFAQIGRKRGEDPRETIVFNSGGGTVKHPIKGDKIEPRLLGESAARPIPEGRDPREILAKWLASSENPYFARNLANIVWQHFFGRGIIEPVDDVRVSNPASNPELLEALARRFTEYKYDFKRLVRDICTSRAYQLSTRPNDTNLADQRNFSHQSIRRLRAEVLLDIINQVTESKEKFRGLPLGARAVQIADGQTSNYFLTTFGRATRETVCSCEVKMEPNLSQALHLINGPAIQNKVVAGGVIARLLAEKKSPQDIMTELYLRCLQRQPNAKEVEYIDKLLSESRAAEHSKVLEDLFWALLNSEEFVFNH